MGSAPSPLSMVSVTSARPSAGRPAVPANTTSSILPPRRGLTPCSPITQENASTTLDLPDPFGPTMQVMPGSNFSVVADANDLKPRSVKDFRYTRRVLPNWSGKAMAGGCDAAPWRLAPRSPPPYRDVPLTRRIRVPTGSAGGVGPPEGPPVSHPGPGRV